MIAEVHIDFPDGTRQTFDLPQGQQSTLGRSPSATVAVPDARELEPEHLLLIPSEESCQVAAAKQARVPVLVEGQPFSYGALPWGSELQIGSLTVRLDKRAAEAKASGPLRFALMLLGVLAALLFAISLYDPAPPLDTKHPEAPSLFGEPQQCPESGRFAVRSAERLMKTAAAKEESYPFDAHHGVEAVQLYLNAIACFAQAGESEPAQEAQKQAATLQKEITRDYRRRQQQLDRALAAEDYRTAVRAISVLLELLQENRSEYKAWLYRVAKQVQPLAMEKD